MFRTTKATLFILLLMAALPLSAQVPQGISYQAVACDANGVSLVNQHIRVRASILRDGPNGQPQWIEVHSIDPVGQTLKTDAFGLFTINIGQGTIQPGGTAAQFQDIDWSYGNIWLKMELDATGSGSFAFIGASRMWSVPYAFYSRKAETAKTADVATTALSSSDDKDKDPTNELRDLHFDPTTGKLSLVPVGQGSQIVQFDDKDKDPTNELREFKVDPVTGKLTLVPVGQGSGTVDFDPSSTNELRDLKYDPATGTISIVPLGQGGQSITLDDKDKDPTNELREFKIDPVTGYLTLVPVGQGSSTITFDPNSTNELQNLVYDPVSGSISLTNSNVTINLNDKDKDPTNELQQISWDPGTNTFTLVPYGTPGGNTTFVLPDPSPTNELQGLVYNPQNNTITITPSPTAPGLSSTIVLDDNDKSPTNELQSLQWDPVSKTLSLVNNPNGPTTVTIGGAGDQSETNELQILSYDPVNNTLSLSPSAVGQPVVKLDDNDKNPTNEIQTLSFDPATNKISISGAPGSGSPANSITLDDADKNPTNEIQTLSFDPVTNKISISGGAGNPTPAGSITLDDQDKSPTNELQSLNFDPVSHTLSIYPPPTGGAQTVSIADADSNPTNELQTLGFDSLTRVLSISKGNSISLLQTSPAPGLNEYPDCGGKPDFRLLVTGSFTVPPGKNLFLTAAGRFINLGTANGFVKHPNSPAMPILGEGVTIVDCNCTAYIVDKCTNIDPVIIDFTNPNYMTNGYMVPLGKVLVIKSGIEIDEGRIDVSTDNGLNWSTITIALSPYEAASRAPTFPGGTRIRPPGFASSRVLTGYQFDF